MRQVALELAVKWLSETGVAPNNNLGAEYAIDIAEKFVVFLEQSQGNSKVQVNPDVKPVATHVKK